MIRRPAQLQLGPHSIYHLQKSLIRCDEAYIVISLREYRRARQGLLPVGSSLYRILIDPADRTVPRTVCLDSASADFVQLPALHIFHGKGPSVKNCRPDRDPAVQYCRLCTLQVVVIQPLRPFAAKNVKLSCMKKHRHITIMHSIKRFYDSCRFCCTVQATAGPRNGGLRPKMWYR